MIASMVSAPNNPFLPARLSTSDLHLSESLFNGVKCEGEIELEVSYDPIEDDDE